MNYSREIDTSTRTKTSENSIVLKRGDGCIIQGRQVMRHSSIETAKGKGYYYRVQSLDEEIRKEAKKGARVCYLRQSRAMRP